MPSAHPDMSPADAGSGVLECLPSNDNCGPGRVCQMLRQGTWKCVPQCSSAMECTGGADACCGVVCTNTRTSVDHCGACGSACPRMANGTAGCVDGRCVIASCNPGFDDCDKSPDDGCEDTVTSDPKNCGKCGHACVRFAGADPTCRNGQCDAVCSRGRADCNGDIRDGCEVDTTSDVMNCGRCGTQCAMGMSCTDGKCM